MLAVRLHDDGLKVWGDRDAVAGSGEVLVRLRAAAITRGELERPVDRLPASPSYELSRVVVGSGDEVYALTPSDRDGVAAEHAVVPADVLAPKPLRLSHVEAAALPMGGLTARQALFEHGRLVWPWSWDESNLGAPQSIVAVVRPKPSIRSHLPALVLTLSAARSAFCLQATSPGARHRARSTLNLLGDRSTLRETLRGIVTALETAETGGFETMGVLGIEPRTSRV